MGVVSYSCPWQVEEVVGVVTLYHPHLIISLILQTSSTQHEVLPNLPPGLTHNYSSRVLLKLTSFSLCSSKLLHRQLLQTTAADNRCKQLQLLLPLTYNSSLSILIATAHLKSLELFGFTFAMSCLLFFFNIFLVIVSSWHVISNT